MWGILVIVVFWEAKGELSKEEIPKHFDVLKSTMRQQHVTILEMVICPKLVRMELGIHMVTLHYSQRWNYNLWLSIIHYLLHYLQTIILHYSTLQKRDKKKKLNYTSSKKQNVRSDQSSLSFWVGHCHRQLIGMNMYIT